MRPKLVLVILVLVECFLLGLLMSPGTMMPKSLIAARREYREGKAAETKEALDRETSRLQARRLFLGVSAGAVAVVIVAYAKYRKL